MSCLRVLQASSYKGIIGQCESTSGRAVMWAVTFPLGTDSDCEGWLLWWT